MRTIKLLGLAIAITGLVSATPGCTTAKKGGQKPGNGTGRKGTGGGTPGTASQADDPGGKGTQTPDRRPAPRVASGVKAKKKAFALVSTESARSSFAGLRSARLRKVATTFPRPEQRPIAAPLSLTASDGTGLELISMTARAVLEGPLAFTELHLVFKNPRPRTIEGRFAITLPPKAAISRLSMKLPTGWMEAEVVERQAARRIYEDFLHRRQDPALLEKKAGNEFRARIFPIPASGTKEIKISFSQQLNGDKTPYRLPLRGLPQMRSLSITAFLARAKQGAAATSLGGTTLTQQVVRVQKQAYKPDRDFVVEQPAGAPAGLRHSGLAVARIKPTLSVTAAAPKGLLVMVDTSASRAAGFASQIERLGVLLRALKTAHGDAVGLQLVGFDQTIGTVYKGTLGGLTNQHLSALSARRALGASDLHGALRFAAGVSGLSRLVLVTDAVPTAGKTGGDALRGAVRALKGRFERLDMIVVGGIRDEEIAAKLARGNLEKDGVVLDGAKPAAELARRIGLSTVSKVEVNVPGAKWVWPSRLDGLQPGDEVLVYADLSTAKIARGAKGVVVQLSGGLKQTVEVALAPVKGPLLERAWVRARIARLSHQRDTLGAGDRDLKAGIDKQIVALSIKHRVLCDKTALLVLETEHDYRRYKIDRKALANILTVGASGIEVLNRKQIVLNRPKTVVADGRRRDELDDVDTGVRTGKKRKATRGRRAGLSGRVSGAGRLAAGPGKGASGGSGERVKRLTRRRYKTIQIIRGIKADTKSSSPAVAAIPKPAPAAVAPAAKSVAAAPSRNPSPRIRRSPVAKRRRSVRRRPRRPRRRPISPIVRRPPRRVEGRRFRSHAAPFTGRFAKVKADLRAGRANAALQKALVWRAEKPGDVLALIALGEALTKLGERQLAARAYGSIIDLFPSRADLRRFAGQRLEALGKLGQALAADSFAEAVVQRPDHPNSHRMLAWALVRLGRYEDAFVAIATGLRRSYPSSRFRGVMRIMREDLGIIAAAWLAAEPKRRDAIEKMITISGAKVAKRPSLRFLLSWETDSNDVDFHIYDGRGGHAYYSNKELPSGGQLYADVTTGYGPECFTIFGKPPAFPYRLQIHYYRRGPMGYGMGRLQVLQHDGRGGLRFQHRPFVVMVDRAYVDLGKVRKPL